MTDIKNQNIHGDNQQFADKIENNSPINGNVTVNDAGGNINQAGRDVVSIVNNYSIPKKIIIIFALLFIMLIAALLVRGGNSNTIEGATITSSSVNQAQGDITNKRQHSTPKKEKVENVIKNSTITDSTINQAGGDVDNNTSTEK